MGHYRSEMGFDEQDRQEEQRKKKQRADLVKGIKADIEKRGIEHVLADILLDDWVYKNKHI